MNTAFDLGPALAIVAIGACFAFVPVMLLWRRHQHAGVRDWLRALTLATLFLTFDLVLFGAFTRLSDSGLGCPDWPGCYGSASPWGAYAPIGVAQAELPSGPVTHGKAWIEMTHRYLATGVGALITVLMIASAWATWRGAQGLSPGWAAFIFVWVCVQGAFGALTVTMKLYPAIVTAHLLGGLALLGFLAIYRERLSWRPLPAGRLVHAGVIAVLVLVVIQAALGGWVSTNYAVLACRDVPTCQGEWWPTMDFVHGFTLLRDLGRTGAGDGLPFAALTAIHMTHRIGALAVAAASLSLAILLVRAGRPLRRFGFAIAGAVAWQFATGLSNVIFEWPLPAALMHTGGAAVLLALLCMLLTRVHVTGEALNAGSHPPAAAVSVVS